MRNLIKDANSNMRILYEDKSTHSLMCPVRKDSCTAKCAFFDVYRITEKQSGTGTKSLTAYCLYGVPTDEAGVNLGEVQE